MARLLRIAPNKPTRAVQRERHRVCALMIAAVHRKRHGTAKVTLGHAASPEARG